MEYTVYPKLILIQIVIYLLILSPFLFSIRIGKGKLYYKTSENYRRCVILLGVIFSVFASYDGDWYHYIPIVKSNYIQNDAQTHIEGIHVWIIKYLSFGSYIWWRLIIWGTSYWLIWLSLKRLNHNTLLTWTCVMAVCLIQMCISRATLGIALLFYGFVCVIQPKIRIWSVIKGLLLMSLSLIFHKSMIIYIVASLFALIHYKKFFLALFICFLPILIKIFTNILLLYVMADEVSHAAEGYLSDETKEKGIGANLYSYTYYCIMVFVFCLFFIGRKKLCPCNSLYSIKLWQNNYNIYYIYIVVWGALTANQIGNNDISYRILWGIYLPSAILISYMIRHNYKTSFNIILVLGLFLTGFYRLFYAYYLQSIGTGI